MYVNKDSSIIYLTVFSYAKVSYCTRVVGFSLHTVFDVRSVKFQVTVVCFKYNVNRIYIRM